MDAERARAFLLTLPHVLETQQWGDNLLFWVGDKAIGGKMFCLIDLDPGATSGVICYLAGQERYQELLEREDLRPAPYFARIYWVAAESWSALRNAEWESELRAAHELTYDRLPQRVKDTLALPVKERAKLVAEGRKALAAKAEKEKAAKSAKAAAKKSIAKPKAGRSK